MRRILLGTLFVLWVLLVAAFSWVRPALAQEQDCIRIGGDLVIAAGQTCQGDAIVIGGDLVVQGAVGGNAVAIGGSVRVSGQVTGDVVSLGAAVEIAAGAEVQGDVAALGGQLRLSPQAVVRGSTLEGSFLLPGRGRLDDRPLVSIGMQLLGAVLASGLAFGLCLVLALVLRSLWPRRTACMVSTLRQNLAPSVGMGLFSGFLLAVALPLLTLFLVIIIVGLLIVPFLAVAVVLLYLAALTISGLALGETLVARTRRESPPDWLVTILGVAILVPLAIFPGVLVPCLGPIWAALVPSAGLGAIVLSRVGTLSRPAAGPVL